jgi:hypothetical protein
VFHAILLMCHLSIRVCCTAVSDMANYPDQERPLRYVWCDWCGAGNKFGSNEFVLKPWLALPVLYNAVNPVLEPAL